MIRCFSLPSEQEIAKAVQCHDRAVPGLGLASRKQVHRTMDLASSAFACCAAALLLPAASMHVKAAAAADKPVPRLAFEPRAATRLEFGGFVGERIEAMVDHWLLRAPGANPGMLEMFRLRDREPAPQIVPWAGEFVGKYLISAIQTLPLSARADLRALASDVVAQLIATQADDGYLGPFRKPERLRGHWDLWSHYHALLALLMWHEATGDPAALDSARRAADLVCATYLDTGHRLLDAGSDEMNLAIVHGLGWLHRVTGEDRYRRMMAEIEKDWERAGDYLRTGLDGLEFWQSPRPRWESLHDLQGLVELYRITADARYREAFEHHWRSIARWDARNTGGFSSGEQATGNPYAPTPIETCCTIAWMALSVDMLALTGDPRVADALELATLNAWAGAQHPSGRWCTYSTPMDGAREASAHAIVFQSRAGTPELNCCSVNGPRGWGMLAEWAVMTSTEGVVLNWLGPLVATVALPDQSRLTLRVTGDYPWQLETDMAIEPEREQPFTLRIRVPAWSTAFSATCNNELLPSPAPGAYLAVNRVWRKGDRVSLKLDPHLRAAAGAREARGCVSLYRGPILLAWDQRLHDFDENNLPPIDLSRLSQARVTAADNAGTPAWRRQLEPRLVLDLPTANGPTLHLCDFASAGATGTRYRTWLRAESPLPPPVVTRTPRDGARIAGGKVAFRWTRTARLDDSVIAQTLRISLTEDFRTPTLELPGLREAQTLVDIDARFEPDRWYFWDIVTANDAGQTRSPGPPARFRIDPSLPPAQETLDPPHATGPRGEWVSAALRGNPTPQVGQWQPSTGWRSAPGPDGANDGAVALDGNSERLVYTLGGWPENDYSLSIRFKIRSLPSGRIGQIFSAWCAPMDDPLRLVIDDGRLFARIEAGSLTSTQGVPIEPGRWHHATVVKAEDRLTLFLDGKEVTSTPASALISTRAIDCALGGNPHYTGNEFLAIDLADFAFFPRALGPDEVGALGRAAASQSERR